MILRICFILSVAGLLSAQTSAANSPLANYTPITGEGRLKWFTVSTVGPTSLLGAGVISSAWGTAFNRPPEYGPTWEGFGKRYGMRLTGVSTGNAMEASLGAVWGEDPRYFRAEGQTFKQRVGNILKMTFVAPGRDGRLRPAYARYAGLIGNNTLSNAWRVESETSVDDTVIRCITGVTGRMAGNAFAEFWPDVKRLIGRKNKANKAGRP
jgi:hypothetical protein